MRVTVQSLAAALGGTQSLHTNGYDEALALPTAEAATLALRTQQIVAYESGIANTADPLAGSYYVENLTTELESARWSSSQKSTSSAAPRRRSPPASSRRRSRAARTTCRCVSRQRKYCSSEPTCSPMTRRRRRFLDPTLRISSAGKSIKVRVVRGKRDAVR